MLSSLHKRAGALRALVPGSSVFYWGSEPSQGRSEETGAWKSSQPPLLSHPHSFSSTHVAYPLKSMFGHVGFLREGCSVDMYCCDYTGWAIKNQNDVSLQLLAPDSSAHLANCLACLSRKLAWMLFLPLPANVLHLFLDASLLWIAW